MRLFALAPLLLLIYLVYTGVYPSSDFYEADFEEVTRLKFPKNAEIIYKTASFPDHFGDYTSSFLVDMREVDIKYLENQLIKIGFTTGDGMAPKELNYIEQKIKRKPYSKRYYYDQESGRHYSVGFLEDQEFVIITRVSW